MKHYNVPSPARVLGVGSIWFATLAAIGGVAAAGSGSSGVAITLALLSVVLAVTAVVMLRALLSSDWDDEELQDKLNAALASGQTGKRTDTDDLAKAA